MSVGVGKDLGGEYAVFVFRIVQCFPDLIKAVEKLIDRYCFCRTDVFPGFPGQPGINVDDADINGALNILKKSSVVSLTTLYSRGQVDSPLRIRIA